MRLFNASPLASEHPTLCCAGIGFGQVLAIGPNLAQGDEMNRASKLGEDIARGVAVFGPQGSGVVVEDIDAYNVFLDDFIFKLPGVSQVRSNIILKEIKADTALPFR